MGQSESGNLPSRAQILEDIAGIEREVELAKERLAAARGMLLPESVDNYSLHGPAGSPVTLADLFGNHADLIVIHNMGRSCAYCTLWADGFNGVVEHLENRAAFVVISPDDPQIQSSFAESRGWRFRMASAEGTTFIKDMGFLREDGYWPGVSAFRKRPDGGIERVNSAFLGPGDDFCAVWHLFDLLAEGPNGWEPRLSYEADGASTAHSSPLTA